MMDYELVYNTLYKEGYHIDILTNIGLQYAKDLVQKYEFNSILDVGCSQGLAVDFYQKNGKDAYGIDISKIGIDKAKELGIKNCVQASVLKIPYKTNRFDVVVSSDVLEHITDDDVNQALTEVCRVAKKYMFFKISTKKEGNKKWIHLLHDKYEEFNDLDNLHVSVHRHPFWIEKIEELNKFKFKERYNRFLIFERI